MRVVGEGDIGGEGGTPMALARWHLSRDLEGRRGNDWPFGGPAGNVGESQDFHLGLRFVEGEFV